MRRAPELAPLSQEHRIALGVARILRRADTDDLDDTVALFRAYFASEWEDHHAKEEDVLLDDLPPEMAARLVDEHRALRDRGTALLAEPDVERAREVGDLLAEHVRFEERVVFTHLEAAAPRRRLHEIGRLLQDGAHV